MKLTKKVYFCVDLFVQMLYNLKSNKEQGGENMEEVMFTFKAKLFKRYYPKGNKKVKHGDWQINRMKVVEYPTTDGFQTKYGQVTIIGVQPALEDDDTIYTITATQKYEEKFNEYQYEVVHVQEQRDLNSAEEKRAFLQTFLTDKQVNSLYEAFADPFEVLESGDISELTSKVKGVGEKTAEKIMNKYLSSKELPTSYIELLSMGLTHNMIGLLKQTYTSTDIALGKIKDNPYVLAEEVRGIGFLKAQEIAEMVGIPKTDPRAVRAFILHHFSVIGESGHTYTTLDILEDDVVDKLGLEDIDVLDEQLDILVDKGLVKHFPSEDGDVFALRSNFLIEKEIARHIHRLLGGSNNIQLDKNVVMERIKEQEERQGYTFTNRQLEGVFAIMNNNVTIIRGWGGSGKSSSVAGVLACVQDVEYSFVQTALSGKASVNLADITGQEGYTIHRLLEYNVANAHPTSVGDGVSFFGKHEQSPLRCDMVILDETSMVDAKLFLDLIQAIPTGAKFVMLGDTNQLESIGIGNVMKDLIDSGVVPCVTFDEIHRQGAKSGIIPTSIKISQGEKLYNNNHEGIELVGELKDLKTIAFSCDKGDTKPSIDLIMQEFKAMYRESKDISEIAIVLPTKSSGTSCYKVNKLVQDLVLPRKRGEGIELGTTKEPYTIYKGDKVINLKNFRHLDIFNGNMGEVVDINHEEGTVTVDFYNRGEKVFGEEEIQSLALGYAVTCHKCQGSTVPYLVYCIDYSHYTMLNKEQVYTGITRAKKKCSFIFETKALNKAITTSGVKYKRTFLYPILMGEIA